jgi:Putative zinc-finger
MKCVQPASVDDIERYLTGLLPDEQQQAFEEHYFGCAECFARLEAMRAIQTAARTVKPRSRSRWWMPGALGLAAALALAVGLWFWWSGARTPRPAPVARSEQPSDRLVLLARFDPPSWSPVTLRGGGPAQSSSFRAAMKTYQAGNYAAAAEQLETVVARQPSLTEARFYLGISSIMSGNRTAGIDQLRHVVAEGDTPWLEQARFYLAKALIGSGDLAGATSQLEQVVAIRGDFAGESQKLLAALRTEPRR